MRGGPGDPFAEPGAVPGRFGDLVRSQLFARRVVLVAGRLDSATSAEAAMELMTLDASGDERVTVHLDSPDGDVDAALALMDVIDLLGVPVTVAARGRVGGPALGVLAVGNHRTATPHAVFIVRQPEVSYSARAGDLERWADAQRRQWEQFCARTATAVGRSVATVAADFDAGAILSPEEARDYGLVDEVEQPGASLGRLPDRRLGFGPR
jgi:ATP-dependent Clp protease, protease subunit